MRTRQKDSNFLPETSNFRQKIKASPSEIMKDLLQINDSIQLSRKFPIIDIDSKKPQKVLLTQRPRKYKTRITEDIGPILGLASLINEIDNNFPAFVCEKKPKHSQSVCVQGKKVTKAPKPPALMKISGFTRAETHLGIARFISERLKRN